MCSVAGMIDEEAPRGFTRISNRYQLHRSRHRPPCASIITDLSLTKQLVQAFNASAAPGQTLLFVDGVPYSASFYSNGRARSLKSLAMLESVVTAQPVFVGMSLPQFEALDEALRSRLQLRGRYGRYVLLVAPGPKVTPSPAIHMRLRPEGRQPART